MAWGLFTSDPYTDFCKRVVRLQKFVEKSSADILMEDYVELRRHLRKLQLFIVEMKSDLEKEEKKISTLRQEMRAPARKLHDELTSGVKVISQLVDSMRTHTEKALEIQVPVQAKEQREKLIRAINLLKPTLDHLELTANELLAEIKWTEKEEVKRAPAIPVVGTLSNGWRIANIQKVIIQLGGHLEATRGGSHPYKIIYPNARPIPLGESTPPWALVKEVNAITGYDKTALAASFNFGRLVE